MASATVATVSRTPGTRAQATSQPKRSLRGAAGGSYVGPVLSLASGNKESSISHATASTAAGGVEDSTGYRASDTYSIDAGTSGLTGGADVITQGRKTGRTAYTGKGVQGGSTPGLPAGRSSNGHTSNAFDKRSNIDGGGGRAIGSAGRGTQELGTTVTKFQGRPAPSSSASSSGVPAVIGGSGKLTVSLHADDITDGANLHKGIEVAVFAEGTDTDEDGASPIAILSADAGTDTTDLLTGLTAADYACYVRWRYAKQANRSKRTSPGTGALSSGLSLTAVGPWSARLVVTVS